MATRGSEALSAAVDDVVQRAVPDVPGVVAGVTTREGTAYLGASGVRDVATGVPMTTDTVLAMFSTTKAVTAVTALQLLEEGRLDLDAPAAQYAPALGEVQVLDGFDDAGSPLLRPPRTPVTTKHLLLHTAGFGYDFFDAQYRRLATEHGQPPIVAATRRALQTPLLFDPGTRWQYGSSTDWVGQVVEGITGRRLGEVVQERVLGPLGMDDTGFSLSPAMQERRATVHARTPDGGLRPTRFALPEPEVDMGGHGLWSTVPDYLRFLRMWLDDGRTPSGEQVLRPETVELAVSNQLGDLQVTPLPGVDPSLTHPVDFFPGLAKSWSYAGLVNDEDAPTGRRAGSVAWAGLANLYWWVDRTSGVAGLWACQLFPFVDPAAYGASLELETATYRALSG